MTTRLPADDTGPPALHGLVLAGGRSTRMKRDKALLEYGGRAQVVKAFEVLREVCDRVFVSCRRDQLDGRFEHLPRIHDRPPFEDLGPIGGILSAMASHVGAAWLVAACDLPFLDGDTLKDLADGRDPTRLATAYRSAHDGLPEPVCAIYEPAARARLVEFVEQGLRCPRKFLIRSSVKLMDLRRASALENVNRPEEYEAARRNLEA